MRTTAPLKGQVPSKFPKVTGQPCCGQLCSSREQRARAQAYLVESRHGCGAHDQGYADDGVAVEAVRVSHHHDPSDSKDGRHNLDGRKEMAIRELGGIGWASKVETFVRVQ